MMEKVIKLFVTIRQFWLKGPKLQETFVRLPTNCKKGRNCTKKNLKFNPMLILGSPFIHKCLIFWQVSRAFIE